MRPLPRGENIRAGSLSPVQRKPAEKLAADAQRKLHARHEKERRRARADSRAVGDSPGMARALPAMEFVESRQEGHGEGAKGSVARGGDADLSDPHRRLAAGGGGDWEFSRAAVGIYYQSGARGEAMHEL